MRPPFPTPFNPDLVTELKASTFDSTVLSGAHIGFLPNSGIVMRGFGTVGGAYDIVMLDRNGATIAAFNSSGSVFSTSANFTGGLIASNFTSASVNSVSNGSLINFGFGSALSFQVLSVVSSVNYLQVKGNAAGAIPVMETMGTDTNISFGFYTKGNGNINFTPRAGVGGNLVINGLGGGLQVKEGANARSGVATLVAGTVTVSNTSISAATRIQLSAQETGVLAGILRVGARVNGTSFTITSSVVTDTASVAWFLVEGI